MIESEQCCLVQASQVAQWYGICLPVQEMQEMWFQFLDLGAPLDEEMATHSDILAWEIPQTGKSDRLQSMRSQRAGHN